MKRRRGLGKQGGEKIITRISYEENNVLEE